MNRRLLFIILLVSMFGLSYAQVEDTNQEDLIKEALELLGYPEFSKYSISSRLVNSRWVLGLSSEECAKMEKDMVAEQKNNFNEIIESLKEDFSKDKEKFLVVLQWLRSPLSRKMTQLHVQAYSPEAICETNCYAYYLQNNPPTKERMAWLQKHFEEGRNRSSYAIPGLGFTLYIFRSASDDELKEYLDFWTSKPGKWFDESISVALWADGEWGN